MLNYQRYPLITNTFNQQAFAAASGGGEPSHQRM
jgi:hypothetical protein